MPRAFVCISEAALDGETTSTARSGASSQNRCPAPPSGTRSDLTNATSGTRTVAGSAERVNAVSTKAIPRPCSSPSLWRRLAIRTATLP